LFPLIQNNLKCKMHFFALIKIGIQLLRFLILISSIYIPSKNEKKLSKKRKKFDIIGALVLVHRAELLLGQDLGMDLLSDDDDQDGEEGDDDDAVIVPQKPPPGRASRPMSAYRRE
jgi:hypothetical protein